MLTSALTGISFWRIAIDVYYICNTFLFKVHAVTLSASCPRYSIPLSNSCRFSKSVRWINFIVWTPLLSNDHRSVLNLWKCNYRMMSQLLRPNSPISLHQVIDLSQLHWVLCRDMHGAEKLGQITVYPVPALAWIVHQHAWTTFMSNRFKARKS